MDRPTTMAQMVGQEVLLDQIRTVIAGAGARHVRPPHILLSGPAGYGKTTLAAIIAKDVRAELVQTNGAVLKRPGDLVGALAQLSGTTVFFIDEIHRLPLATEEVLYEALEDGMISVVAGGGNLARYPLPPILFIGATTSPGTMSTPLRDRFGFHGTMKDYSLEDLDTIVERRWSQTAQGTGAGCARSVSAAAKGTPRIAIHLAERVLDVAALEHRTVDKDLVEHTLTAFGYRDGLDDVDWKILQNLCVTFGGRPVGIDALSQVMDLDVKSLQAREAALIRAGFMIRTKQGRLATAKAHKTLRGEA